MKNNFYDSLINVVRKLGEKKIVAEDFNGHVGSNAEASGISMKVMVMELGIRKGKGFLSWQ